MAFPLDVQYLLILSSVFEYTHLVEVALNAVIAVSLYSETNLRCRSHLPPPPPRPRDMFEVLGFFMH